jgi:hypothetical protein
MTFSLLLACARVKEAAAKALRDDLHTVVSKRRM